MSSQTTTTHVTETDGQVRRTRAHLVCNLGQALFGIDVRKVRHVGTIGRVRRLPWMPSFVKGVTRLRRRLLPLIDLREKLGLPNVDYGPRTRAVEVDVGSHFAVAVDSVEGVSHFDAHTIDRVVRSGGGTESPVINGLARVADRPCLLLDTDRILTGHSPAQCVEDASRVARRTGTWSVDANAAQGASHTPRMDADATNADIVPLRDSSNTQQAAEPEPLPKAQGYGMRYYGPLEPQRELCPLNIRSVPDREARREHLAKLLAKSVVAGNRRIPGFRAGSPRLKALATALLRMPAVFRTREAAPVVASLLGCLSETYGLTHFRYDLGKLRARNLAERIGTKFLYRLTTIGCAVCEVFAERRSIVDARSVRAGVSSGAERSALSA